MKIILGSSSKFRQKVFSQVTPDFESVSPDIDEKAIRDDDPRKLTLMIANAKADALVSQIKEPAILVTADQVVLVDGQIREKPQSESECREFLRSYDYRPIEVINGVVATNTETGKRAEGNNIVRIQFRVIPEAVIDQFISEGDVLHCAGGLKAEHPALKDFIESIDGSAESLQGVPVDLTKRLIDEAR